MLETAINVMRQTMPDASVFFSAQVSQEYSRHTSRFLCLDETAEVEDMEVELLKGTERY